MRIEASVGRFGIFDFAGRAHLKWGHRSIAAIIRNGPDNTQARTAMRAVGKWMAEAAFGRIDYFLRASRADRCVRRNLSMRMTGDSPCDAELRRQITDKDPGFDAVNSSQRRRFAADAHKKIVNCVQTSADAYQNAVCVVQNLAA